MSANQNEKLNPVTKSIINAQLSRRGVLAGVGAELVLVIPPQKLLKMLATPKKLYGGLAGRIT